MKLFRLSRSKIRPIVFGEGCTVLQRAEISRVKLENIENLVLVDCTLTQCYIDTAKIDGELTKQDS